MRSAFVVGALCLGLALGEFLATNFAFRETLARLVRRGQLLALVDGRGIYDGDVERAWETKLYDGGAEADDVPAAIATAQKMEALAQLIERKKLDVAAANQPISRVAVDREMDLLHWQFIPEKHWGARLRYNLRGEVAANLRARGWLEARLKLAPNEKECRQFYDAHLAWFREPDRFRASHLFLAAPVGYPDEVIATKRALIQNLAARLTNGEDFNTLTAQFSEDEETKSRGGDLNWFAAERMLPAVFDAAQSLGEDATSAPIRSRLGFHLLRSTQKLPATQLDFAQAEPEIALLLENQERPAHVAALLAQLDGKIEFAARRN